MGAALEMPQKHFQLLQVLGPSQFFSGSPDAQLSQLLKVKGLTSPPGTSGTIRSCHLQLHKPAFLSLRKGLMRNISLVYSLGGTAMPRYILEEPSELWNIDTSQGVRGLPDFSSLPSFWSFPYYDFRGSNFFSPAHLSFYLILWSLSVFPQGVFYPLENLADPPFPPVPFMLPERSDSMLYIGISEYFFKSASFAYFTAGAFNVTLSTEEVRRFNGWWQLAPTFNLL